MQRSLTTVVMALLLATGLLAGTAATSDGVAAQDGAAALPDGLALTQLAGISLEQPLAVPALLRLERLTVSEAPDGAELRAALGTELLYVVSGPVVIADDFGLEGRLESGAELPLQAPTSYSLRADEGAQATVLRFSLLDPVSASGSASPSNVKSEVLIERELTELPVAPVELRLLRAVWDPGVDAGRRVFAGPLGLMVEQGILSVTGPSGLEGQLAVGEPFIIPAGVPARLRNAEAEPTTMLVAEILPEGAAAFGSDADAGPAGGSGASETKSEPTDVANTATSDATAAQARAFCKSLTAEQAQTAADAGIETGAFCESVIAESVHTPDATAVQARAFCESLTDGESQTAEEIGIEIGAFCASVSAAKTGTTADGDCLTETFYQVTAENGRFEDWDLGGPWRTVDGMLISDGSASSELLAPIPAIGCRDYAVQMSVQWVSGDRGNTHGLVARATEQGGINGGQSGHGRIYVWVGPWDDWQEIATKDDAQDTPQNSWRILRLEVSANAIRFSADESQLDTVDNRFIEDGGAGLYVGGGRTQISVRCFEIISIDANGTCRG